MVLTPDKSHTQDTEALLRLLTSFSGEGPVSAAQRWLVAVAAKDFSRRWHREAGQWFEFHSVEDQVLWNP